MLTANSHIQLPTYPLLFSRAAHETLSLNDVLLSTTLRGHASGLGGIFPRVQVPVAHLLVFKGIFLIQIKGRYKQDNTSNSRNRE